MEALFCMPLALLPKALALQGVSRVAFTRADFQPQMAFDSTGETGQHALRGGLAADVDVALIGVAGKTQVALLQVFIH